MMNKENAAAGPRKRRSLPRGVGQLTDQTTKKDRKRGPMGITEQQRPQQTKSAEPTQHKQQQTNERLTLDGVYHMLAEEQSTSERERSLLDDDHLINSDSALLRLLRKDWKASPSCSHSTGARTLSLNKELIACAAWSEMHSLPADDTTLQSTTSSAAQKEETPATKEAFRQYFMRAMTATFGDELDQLREQEQLSEAPEKLELLVDCLGLGMRAYTQEERALCLRQE